LIPREKHDQVLAGAVDVPQQRPDIPLPLNSVGISGKTIWVDFTDPEWQRISFTAEIRINLPARYRGIHMSRIEQAISDLYGRRFASLTDYAVLLGRKVLESQNADHGFVRLIGKVPILRQTPVSAMPSLNSAEITATALLKRTDNGIETTLRMKAEVYHLTACPCTQQYNQYLYDAADSLIPQSTHSQRSQTSLEIELPNPGVLTYTDIFSCLASALHTSNDLLKRSDEAELVLAAHSHPQFAEDAVREVAKTAVQQFAAILPDSTRIRINSLSLESIHIHDVVSGLDMTLGEIITHLRESE